MKAFQFITMTLLGVKLFLRSDELLDLRLFPDADDGNGAVENTINWPLCKISPGGAVEFLAFNIKGKTDHSIKTLMVGLHDKVPELCPVRHLLAWIYISKIRGGYLFPPDKKLKDGKFPDGFFGKTMSRGRYHALYKQYCESYLDPVRLKTCHFGTHSNRKTGYLFAVWGDAPDSELKEAARHEGIVDMNKYKADSPTLKLILPPESRRFVESWRAMRINSTSVVASQMNHHTGFARTLDILKVWYYYFTSVSLTLEHL
jgi:hypothetical protein